MDEAAAEAVAEALPVTLAPSGLGVAADPDAEVGAVETAAGADPVMEAEAAPVADALAADVAAAAVAELITIDESPIMEKAAAGTEAADAVAVAEA